MKLLFGSVRPLLACADGLTSFLVADRPHDAHAACWLDVKNGSVAIGAPRHRVECSLRHPRPRPACTTTLAAGTRCRHRGSRSALLLLHEMVSAPQHPWAAQPARSAVFRRRAGSRGPLKPLCTCRAGHDSPKRLVVRLLGVAERPPRMTGVMVSAEFTMKQGTSAVDRVGGQYHLMTCARCQHRGTQVCGMRSTELLTRNCLETTCTMWF